MVEKRLALALGITLAFTLVQGCVTKTVTTPAPLGSEEETPQAGDDQDKAATPADPAPAAGTTTKPQQPAPEVPKEKSKMTFFVTSTGNGAQGGNFGGLVGADKKCQDLAAAANGGDHTWHAYLSVEGTNAKDRIGTGPWQNQKGKVIAQNVVALHDYLFIPLAADLVDEKGVAVPPTASLILTGSKQDGTALVQTCQGWTSNANNQRGRIGDLASDASVTLGARWNDARVNSACTEQALTQNKSDGRIYCFAID
jgi:hypothetical protein